MEKMNELEKLEEILKKETNLEKAKTLQNFFKTKPGEYGEGDIFLGIVVPVQRKIAQEFKELSIENVQKLLDSEVHEKRLIALLILIEQYKKETLEKNQKKQKNIFDFYLDNAKRNRINNWDLIDISCRDIVGNYVFDKNRDILYSLAKSNNLWEKRIAIVSTFEFIRNKQLKDTMKISKILLKDKHDLIQKAVGWMLREVGKKDEEVLEEFLKKYHKEMPRTMLRYSIEKFPEEKRKKYLKGDIN